MRSDAHDFEGLALDLDRAADDGGVAAKPAPPQRIADDDALVLSANFIRRHEHAAERRLHAEDTEKIGGHVKAADALRVVSGGEVDVPPLEGRQPFERVCLLSPVEEVGGRHALVSAGGIVQRSLGDDRESIHLGKVERMQDERVDDRKDGGIGAETERESENDDRTRGRPLHQSPKCIPQVECEGAHEGVSVTWKWRRDRPLASETCRRRPGSEVTADACCLPGVPGMRTRNREEPSLTRPDGVLLMQVAEDRIGSFPGAQHRREHTFCDAWRREWCRHDRSSSDSSPFQSCSSA